MANGESRGAARRVLVDRETRNAIERATQRGRTLLEDDFAAQLEGDFDVHRDGTVAAKAGGHLSARQAFQRERIVAAIDHKRAAGMNAAESVADYLRDAAFTTLNRFVALKMLEARDLVKECITKGGQSAGYREFSGMAPGLRLLPHGAGYRLYIESLFDELSTEVKVLFDRRDPASVLWPKRATLRQILEVLNSTELAGIWDEDETIGWMYQFFNGQDERRKMREQSQAPRNSRELAVRNQFFTPSYVVRFLTDNTLGRIWYEMCGTNTALGEGCEYLARDPAEKPGELRELAPTGKKDPRDLRVLDPASGSGHFLLYAFDLFVTIYEEAYADSAGPKSEVTGRTLAEDYPALGSLRKALPGLILAHNLYGVDIDQRSAQIAQLALWIRAQKAYRDFGISRAERPRIRRSNIVVAEPLLADAQIVKEFVAKLAEIELGRVFISLVDALTHAADTGLLLRVEQLIGTKATRKQTGDLFSPAEERIRAALASFVEDGHGERSRARRRLFSDDAAHGVGLLAVAEKTFDVILMNPPFGDPTPVLAEHLDREFPRTKYELAAAFLERSLELVSRDGRIGWISSRTWMAAATLETFRRELLIDSARLELVADLGIGVLDSALVETAACVAGATRSVGAPPDTRVFRLLSSRNKGQDLYSWLQDGHPALSLSAERWRKTPRAAFAYWFPEDFLNALLKSPSFGPSAGEAKQGLATTDDFRFLRCIWEVPPSSVGWGKRWIPFAKGGEYEPYYDDIHLVIDWDRNGAALKDYLVRMKGQTHWSRRIASAEYYGRAGVTYPGRTTSDFSPRPLPEGSIFSATGQAVFLRDRMEILAYIGMAYTRIFKQLVELFVGAGDASESGSAARDYTSGILNVIPMPAGGLDDHGIGSLVEEQICERRREIGCDEVTLDFMAPAIYPLGTLTSAIDDARQSYGESCLALLESAKALDAWGCEVYGVSPDTAEDFLSSEVCHFPTSYPSVGPLSGRHHDFDDVGQLVAALCDAKGFKRSFTKKSYWANRYLELASHLYQRHPRDCIRLPIWKTSRHLRTPMEDLVMYLVGCVFGRWDARYSTVQPKERSWSDPLGELGPCAPGALQVGGAPARTAAQVRDYALAESVLWSGMASDDEGHSSDLARSVNRLLGWIWRDEKGEIGLELEQLLGGSLRRWLRQHFFSHHLARYTRSRRQAPIYWQLATASASYSVWLYAHAVTKDTLFRVQNDYATPKLAHEERRLEAITDELRNNATAGQRGQRRELAAQERFVDELRAFLDEVKRVGPLWNPSLNDGVIINFAPLWRLVPQHKAWQRKLKSTWDALCEGRYDWAHLAMHLWPERVVRKCAKDRSLAIAHGLEDVFWLEGPVGTWTARKLPTRSVEELLRERTSPAVKSALKSLLEAPSASGDGGRGRGGRRRAKTSADGGDA